MIPDETIDRIRESADIVQIIGEHVPLRRMGSDFRGPCPFHQGTHRNFSVSTKKRIYYCFVCHEGGDVFSFLQKRLGLDWPSAVRLAAEKTGIEIREIESRREGPDPREPIWEVNAAAAEYFERMLWDGEAGAPAREYLESRRIGRDLARKFGLGFAPREIGLMRTHLGTLGYDDALLLEAGLMVRPEEAVEPRPRFRGRLIFPILDVMGRHVGFGGRVIGQGEPKYLNSPESPVFSKGKLLYGLSWARNAIRREDRALVVEGYFDVVRLVAAGIESVIAPLGTALTEDQAALLARYTKNVYLLYDSDKAGQRATFRAADALLGQRATVQVVTLPAGEDPDTFVDEHGASGLEAQLGDAIDVFERKVQILERSGWFADLRRRRRAIDHLLPTIRAAADPVTRDLYLARASEVSGVAKEVLARELGVAGGRAAPAGDVATVPPAAPGPQPTSRRDAERRTSDRRAAPVVRGAGAERELVRAMLHRRGEIDAIGERVGPEMFRDRRYRSIFAALLEQGSDTTVEALERALDDEAVQAMQVLLQEPDAQIDPVKTVAHSLAKLHIRDLEDEQESLSRDLAIATSSEHDAIILRKRQIQKEIKDMEAIGVAASRWFGKTRS
jgi:DNA primase